MAGKRKPFSWKIAGKRMPTAPDPDGEIFLIVEVDVESGFPGYLSLGHPTVTFTAGIKNELWTSANSGVDPPIYRYSVEVDFHTAERHPGTSFRVIRSWDREGRMCRRETRTDDKYHPAPYLEEYLANPLKEGIWRAIINGEVRDQVAIYEETWKNIAPFLIQMSEAPEMQKMEKLYNSNVPHEELHGEIGYEEGNLSALIAREEKTVAEAIGVSPFAVFNRPLLRMPPPEKISKERPVRHEDLHTDVAYEE